MIYFEGFCMIILTVILAVAILKGLSRLLKQPVLVTIIDLAGTVFGGVAGYGIIDVSYFGITQAFAGSDATSIWDAIGVDILVMFGLVMSIGLLAAFALTVYGLWRNDSWKSDTKYKDIVTKYYGSKEAWKRQ